MLPTVHYKKGAELPIFEIWWKDARGNLVDFSGVSDFTLYIGNLKTLSWAVTKTAGIVGAVGSGTAFDGGTPNVTVTWDLNELDITAKTYDLQMTARDNAGKHRKYTAIFIVDPAT